MDFIAFHLMTYVNHRGTENTEATQRSLILGGNAVNQLTPNSRSVYGNAPSVRAHPVVPQPSSVKPPCHCAPVVNVRHPPA